MTVARVRETGRGYYQARVSIEGWPYEAVTGRGMEKTTADGRLRKVGLDIAGVQLQVRADLARASIDAQGFGVRIKDLRQAWSDAFRRSSFETTLNANLTTSATVVTVADTSTFPAAGVIHIGTEAILYTGKTATTFTGCTRGAWDTIAQAHFIPDGELLHYPIVGDRPLSLEGRRARLYIYGPGDSQQGDGTLRWLGLCATDITYDGLGTYSLTVDPITRLLAQQIGGDLAESVPIRGILHPSVSPVIVSIRNQTLGRSVRFGVAGFWETQREFCASVSTEIATQIGGASGWSSLWSSGSAIVAQEVPGGLGWRLVYTVGTGAGTASEIWITIASDWGASAVGWRTSGSWIDTTGAEVPPSAAVIPGGYYTLSVPMPVPRASLGWPSGRYAIDPDLTIVGGTVALERRVYLGGLVVPSSTMAAIVDDGEEGYPLRVIGADTTNRYLEAQAPSMVLGPETRIKLGRRLAVGTVESLRAAIAAAGPGIANTGAMPLIGSLDILAATEVTEAAAGNSLGSDRVFEAYETATLAEYVEPELRVLGCYQRIATTGGLEWARLRMALETDAATAIQITDEDIVGPVRVERAQYGQISSVVYRTQFDPKEGEHRSSIVARDVQSSSPNRTAQPHEIAQRSYPESRVVSSPEWWSRSPPEATAQDVVRIALPIFQIFGGPYDTWTIPLGPRHGGRRIGDTVSVTCSKIPNAATGTLGVTAKTGLVVEVSEDISTGEVSIGVHVSLQRFAGYAPGVEVSGQTNVGGNTWDVDFASVASYVRSADVRHHIRTGDLVRVTQFDSATPTEVDGTVIAETSATRLRVTFGAVWTPGGSTWIVRARASSSYASTDRIASYGYQAETASRRVDYTPTDADAWVFS